MINCKIFRYNDEIQTMKKKSDDEIARLTAQLRVFEIKNNSLSEALQQKTKECEQLSAVYDEMNDKLNA